MSASTPRAPLTRDRILETALAVADEGGLEALTMRRIAQRLQVEAMSLYHHVDNKADILDGLLELAVAQIVVPAGVDWRQATRIRARSARDVLLAHRWAALVWVSSTNPGPNRLRYMDSVLGTLRDSGFSADLAHHAFHVLENHILGYTLQQLDFPYDADDLATIGPAFLETLPQDEYPHLAEHVRLHIERTGHPQVSEFDFGLELILDGLERLRDPA